MEDRDPRVGAAAVARSAVGVPRSATRDAPAATGPSERRAATAELMRVHGDAVLGFCIRVLRNRELAEEVRQQTFLEAFRDFDRFERRSSHRTWLFAIASHRCLDALRKRRPGWIESDDDAVVNSHDPGNGPREQLEHAQLTAALEDCMAALPDEMRMTVLMRFQTDLTYEQIAVRLASRADALQMRVSRALTKLRRCLESKGAYGA